MPAIVRDVVRGVGLVVGQLELPGGAGAARCVEGDAQARALAEGVGEGWDADADLGPVAAPCRRYRLDVVAQVGVLRPQRGRGRAELALRRPQPAGLHVRLFAVGADFRDRRLQIGIAGARLHVQIQAGRTRHHRVAGEGRRDIRQRLAIARLLPVGARQASPGIAARGQDAALTGAGIVIERAYSGRRRRCGGRESAPFLQVEALGTGLGQRPAGKLALEGPVRCSRRAAGAGA